MKDNKWIIDRFDDCQVLRYEVPGFEELTLEEKIYIYHLAQAAEAGSSILLDQNFKYNPLTYKVIQEIIKKFDGERATAEWQAFERYAKHLWFANGVHHHYSGEKFTPEFSEEYFEQLIEDCGVVCEDMPTLRKVIFDADFCRWRVTRDVTADVVASSACNYYEGVSTEEAQEYYKNAWNAAKRDEPRHPLNSKLTKTAEGELKELVYREGGLYSEQIKEIISHLEKAAQVANDKQKEVIRLLIQYYRTGEPEVFDNYSIAWLQDDNSKVDFINGFIEVYGDPIGLKGAWEALVNFRNEEASERTSIIAKNAQWFEDNSPINPAYRKEVVRGISAKVVTVAMLGGDCFPSTPIGVNLPNAEWIRRDYGSKSITIDNITDAYDKVSQQSGFGEEFFLGEDLRNALSKWGKRCDDLHTDLHECVGHGSGKLAEGVSQEALGIYGSVIEECRADLNGLYFMGEERLIELGLVPCSEAVGAYYTKYLTNGLYTQLARIKLGDDVEQTHMRCRKVISQWIIQKAEECGAARRLKHNDKSYIEVRDAKQVQALAGELLREIQRIKSEGDKAAAKDIVESLGVKIDGELHREILERYESLNIAPYNGFVNPEYIPIYNNGGEIDDISIKYRDKIW